VLSASIITTLPGPGELLIAPQIEHGYDIGISI